MRNQFVFTTLMAAIAGVSMLASDFADPARAQTAAPSETGKPASPNGAFSSDTTPGATTPAKNLPLDINSASAAEIAALPGIGSTRSRAIIDGRPYQAKNDLVRRNILPPDIYARITSLITAKQS